MWRPAGLGNEDIYKVKKTCKMQKKLKYIDNLMFEDDLKEALCLLFLNKSKYCQNLIGYIFTEVHRMVLGKVGEL